MMESAFSKAATYYLRIPDGAVYGPVDIVTLCIWATDARVIPGCELSEKQDFWFPVEKISELRLNWSVQFTDGTIYGPLNLLAIRILASEKSIPHGVKLSEKGTGRQVILNDAVMPLLIEEVHQMLAGCGALMSANIGLFREAQRLALTEVEDGGAILATMQTRQQETESELLSLSGQLKESQQAYQAKIIQLQQMESALSLDKVRIESKVAEILAQMSLLEKKLEISKHHADELDAQLVQERERYQSLQTESVSTVNKNLAQKSQWEKDLQTTKQRADALEAQLAQDRDRHQILKFESAGKITELLAKKTLLEENLQTSKQRTISLDGQLVQERERYQVSLNESAGKEKFSLEKIKRLEAEIKDAAELFSATLHQVEQSEGRLRDLERKMDTQERFIPKQGAIVEAEVIQAEVLHAETIGPDDASKWNISSGSGRQATRQEPVKDKKNNILNHVEAQLQVELRQWNELKQDKKKKSSPKWF